MAMRSLVWRRHFERQGASSVLNTMRVGRCSVLQVRKPTLGAEAVGALQAAVDRHAVKHTLGARHAVIEALQCEGDLPGSEGSRTVGSHQLSQCVTLTGGRPMAPRSAGRWCHEVGLVCGPKAEAQQKNRPR